MAFPLFSFRTVLGALLVPLALACGTAAGDRPPAPTPAGWRHWVQGSLAFDGPSDWKVASRPALGDALDIFLSRDDAGGVQRCVLVLHLSPMPRFPAMAQVKPFAGQAYDTHIGGAPARRIDPPDAQLPGTSEGVIELGGLSSARRVHFQYAHLDAPTRQAAEQVLASLRTQAKRA